MKNTLADLNNYLFEAIERINDDNLDDAQLEKEIKRSEKIFHAFVTSSRYETTSATVLNVPSALSSIMLIH